MITKSAHNIVTCGVCDKGFAMEQLLRKHGYTHSTKNKCEHCIQYFMFPSELDTHMVKHEPIPQFSCNIVGCSRSYYRKSELMAHLKTHNGKLWKCKHKDCNYEAVDKRYLTAHKKTHGNELH